MRKRHLDITVTFYDLNNKKHYDSSTWIQSSIKSIRQDLFDPDLEYDKAFLQVADLIRNSIAECFETESSPRGEPWEPRVNEESWPLLRKTNAMYESVVFGEAEMTKSQMILDINPNKVPYTIVHQMGSIMRHIPPRPFWIPLHENIDMKRKIKNIIIDYGITKGGKSKRTARRRKHAFWNR